MIQQVDLRVNLGDWIRLHGTTSVLNERLGSQCSRKKYGMQATMTEGTATAMADLV